MINDNKGEKWNIIQTLFRTFFHLSGAILIYATSETIRRSLSPARTNKRSRTSSGPGMPSSSPSPGTNQLGRPPPS